MAKVNNTYPHDPGDSIPVVVWDVAVDGARPMMSLTQEEVESAEVLNWETSGYIALQMPNGQIHIVYNIDIE